MELTRREFVKTSAGVAGALVGALPTGSALPTELFSETEEVTIIKENSKKSLYERLGGYNAIAAVVGSFIGCMIADKQLGRYFIGHCTNSKKKMRQLIVDMLCEATGGPTFYTGRDMKTAHTGLNITESDWQVGVKLLAATLDKFKVPQKEKEEVFTALSGLKSDIVGR